MFLAGSQSVVSIVMADCPRPPVHRKAIYEELHPETRHGGDRKSDQVADLATRSFAEETASVTGKDERSVRRDAERGEKVIQEVLDIISGTKLDTGTSGPSRTGAET